MAWTWNHGPGLAAGVTGLGWQLKLGAGLWEVWAGIMGLGWQVGLPAGLAEDTARDSRGLVAGLGWHHAGRDCATAVAIPAEERREKGKERKRRRRKGKQNKIKIK